MTKLCFVLFGGIIVDRLDAKKLLIIGNYIRGSVIISEWGSMVVIIVNGISFFISGMLLSFVKFQTYGIKAVAEENNLISDFVIGVKYFFTDPIILIMAGMAFFANATFSGVMVSIPFLAIEYGMEVEGYGFIETALGIGTAVAAFIFTIIAIKEPTPQKSLVTCLIQGAIIFSIGITNDFYLALLLFVIVGFLESVVNIIAPSVNHKIIPKPLFGRVLSVMILVMSGSEPISQLISGVSVDAIDTRVIFIFGGILESIVAIGFLVLLHVKNTKWNTQKI